MPSTNPVTHHEKVVNFLKRRAKDISQIAEGVDLSETQVRHAIGVARAQGYDIRRDSLRKFMNLGKRADETAH